MFVDIIVFLYCFGLIDICCPRPGCSERQASFYGTDGRTDTRSLHRPCTACYAHCVNNFRLCSEFLWLSSIQQQLSVLHTGWSKNGLFWVASCPNQISYSVITTTICNSRAFGALDLCYTPPPPASQQQQWRHSNVMTSSLLRQRYVHTSLRFQ